MPNHLWPLALACLALGLASTIAVAWLCAAYVNPARGAVDFNHQPIGGAGGAAGTRVLVTQRALGHSRINAATCAELVLDDKTGDILLARWNSTGGEYSETQAGWPLRALRCRNAAEISITTGNSGMRVSRTGVNPLEGGWELQPFTGGALGSAWRAIPLRPMLPGVIVDTLVFAAMWMVMLAGATALRRARRRARGACARCGYDLRSSGFEHARCPECGAADGGEAIGPPGHQ